jgi:molybdate transport system ATP-binding protein
MAFQISGSPHRGGIVISVRVSHSFSGFSLNLSFEAPSGVTVLFGRSGSGKTSVVRAVAGLMRPEHCHVSLAGRVLSDSDRGLWTPPHERRIGYIFQEHRLFPHLTVKKNLNYGRSFAPPGARADSLDRVVDMLGIEPLLDRRPSRLSGGEKQRVAIGRALLAGPKAILADEPLAALDEARKAEILPYFERLRDELAIPILYVTHSMAEVARLATTIVALENGTVSAFGPAAEVLSDPEFSPAGVRAVGALLQTVVRCHHPDALTELDAGGQALFVPQVPQAPGTPLRVRIAAQEVILSLTPPQGLSALNVIPGRVEHIRRGAGPGAIVSLNTPAGRLLARITARSADRLGLVPGRVCHAIVKSVAIAPEDVGG